MSAAPLQAGCDSPVMPRVALVSCVKKKLSRAAPARDLHTSALFRKMRRYAESHAQSWYILSARYGLLRPEQEVQPYELTLKALTPTEQRLWGAHVLQALQEVLPRRATVVMLAGVHYRQHLEPALRELGFNIEVPMKGLRLGEQLRWLGAP